MNEHWLPDWRDYDIRSGLAHYEGVRTRKLLFFDSFHLRRHQGLTFRMHQPEKEAGNPILRPEQPWEGWRSFWYGRAVLYDARLGRYRAWYETRQDSTSPDGNWERAALKRIAYAESDDGVVWRRPSLHQHERDGSTANSIISVGALGMHFANVIIDQHEADPRKRYKMMFYAQPPGRGQAEPAEGMQVALSADGLRWWLPVDPHEAPIPSGRSWRAGRTTCADAISLYGWSEQHQRYVAFLKSNDVIPTRFRTICWSESEDFINWSRLVNVLAPDDADAPGTEFYYMTVFPCAAGGEATVHLLDADGRAVPGVAPTRFTGDHLHAPIAVPPQIRDRLRGSRARLAATLRDAELFSLTV